MQGMILETEIAANPVILVIMTSFVRLSIAVSTVACYIFSLAGCRLLAGECHSPLARALWFAGRAEEQLLHRCGMWKG